MNKNYKKLIMVEVNDNPKQGKAAQSNKYYEMIYEGGSNFTVKYGRVESSETVIQKPYSQWNSIYNSKIKKGYKDVTDFVSVKVDAKAPILTKHAPTGDSKVDEFLALMKAYTDNLVSTTYSVQATAVSQKQVDEAQKIIDGLNIIATATTIDEKVANGMLTMLYTTIPRRMRDVRDNLLPKIKLDKILIQEQDNLDAMASQVAQVGKPRRKKVNYKPGRIHMEQVTLLDELGLSQMVTIDKATAFGDIGYLLNQSHGRKVEAIFRVNKPSEDANILEWMKTRKDKTCKILIHGTRCSSVLPILEQGLKIRPAGNYQFSGKAYGDGNYFSEVMNKSLNYVGHDRDKVLLVYEVHTGNPFVYNGWYTGNSFSLTLNELTKRGFDSTYVKAGNGLLNSEIIAYSEKQNRIKYIIWLKD